MDFGNRGLFERTKTRRPLKYCVFHTTLLVAHVWDTAVTCFTLGRYTSNMRANILFSDWFDNVDD